jgi:hypothetical protein
MAIASAPTVSMGASTTGGASKPPRIDDDDDELEPAPVKTSAPIAAWIFGALVAAGAIFAAVMLLRSDKNDPQPPDPSTQSGHHVDKPDESARKPDDPLVPAVTIEPLQDLSHLTDANQILEHERWRMLACYKQALVDTPQLTGTVTFSMKIDTAGRVSSVDPSTSLADTRVSDCLLPIFQSMQFKPPVGGATTLSVPVTLSKVPQSMANIPIAPPTTAPSASEAASASAKKSPQK